MPPLAASLTRNSEHTISEVPEGLGLLEALAAKRQTAIEAIGELEESIASIDAVMAMYDPSHAPWKTEADERAVVSAKSAGPSNSREAHLAAVETFFGSDQRTMVVKKIMSAAARPMSSAEIADAYVGLKGKPLDREPLQVVVSRISAILSRLRSQGKVETVDTEGWKNSWRLR